MGTCLCVQLSHLLHLLLLPAHLQLRTSLWKPGTVFPGASDYIITTDVMQQPLPVQRPSVCSHPQLRAPAPATLLPAGPGTDSYEQVWSRMPASPHGGAEEPFTAALGSRAAQEGE